MEREIEEEEEVVPHLNSVGPTCCDKEREWTWWCAWSGLLARPAGSVEPHSYTLFGLGLSLFIRSPKL
jgi:hypothetical protein